MDPIIQEKATPFYKRPKFIIWSLFSILLLIFILQNVEPTTIDILFWSIPEVPKLVIILISFLIGALVALLLGREWLRKDKKM